MHELKRCVVQWLTRSAIHWITLPLINAENCVNKISLVLLNTWPITSIRSTHKCNAWS